jgi:hypothetical protein
MTWFHHRRLHSAQNELWSISALGSRVWFCDRNTCKRFWSDAGRTIPPLATGLLAGHELQPDVARTEERVLQPV